MCVNENKPKRTKNRKYVSHSKGYEYEGVTFSVNAKGSGVFTRILSKTIEQLNICQRKWRRVFALRFDLHQKYPKRCNKNITKFRKNLARKLEREYGLKEIGYLWVREQEKAKAQHYHFVIFLDGNKIKHSSKILRIIKETWENVQSGNTMPTIKSPFYFIDDEQTKENLIYRISYLAKSRGKGYRDKQVNDYSTSRLL